MSLKGFSKAFHFRLKGSFAGFRGSFKGFGLWVQSG